MPVVLQISVTAAVVASSVERLKLDGGVPGGTVRHSNAGGRFSVHLFWVPGVAGVSAQNPLRAEKRVTKMGVSFAAGQAQDICPPARARSQFHLERWRCQKIVGSGVERCRRGLAA